MSIVASDLGLSPSEVHSAIHRLRGARLVSVKDKPNLVGLEESLVHGVKYTFPAKRGEVTRGVPTSFAAEPLKSEVTFSNVLIPVWPWRDGEARGVELEPLTESVAGAATRDQKLYELLALVDAIRDGRARERNLTEHDLVNRLRSLHGQS